MTDQQAGGGNAGIDLPSWIREVVALDAARPALQFEGTWRPWSYLASGIQAIERVAADLNLPAGARCGLLMRNRPEIVRAVIGILGTGHCVVTLNPGLPGDELAAEVERLELPVLIGSARDWTDPLREAARRAGTAGVLLGDDEGASGVVVEASRRSGATTAPGVAVQMLTSGTTGPPKRIDLLYRSLEHEAASTASYSSSGMPRTPRLATGVAILWNPILHIGGLRGLITNVIAGRRLAMLERFSVPSWVALVREHRPRAIALVPSAMQMVLDAGVPKDALEGVEVVTSGTAPLPPATLHRWEESFGIPVLVVYGATEFAGGVAGWTIKDWRRFGEAKRGSVGRPNRGIDARVVDPESGAVRPVGDAGLLEVRGPQLARDGWLRTTDLARIDEDGFIWIEGRADDVINRGGFKVGTNAVADALRRHPAISDACVVGVPDERLGQVPVAAVELTEGASLSEDELASWAEGQLTGYQRPVRYRILAELPRTPSMKVSQPLVKRLFVEEPA
jgi:long-chain acyl-CoA synthetase